MIPLATELLKKRPQVLQEYRAKFQHVFVDEYQDVTRDQVDLLRLLLGPQASVTVCGDDDQSIYGWRCAAARSGQCALPSTRRVSQRRRRPVVRHVP